MERRYIDAIRFEQAIKGKELFPGYFDNGFIYNELHRQPTADVEEVVRCKDCRRSRTMIFDGFYVCKRHRAVRKADAFCSYGERRDK